MLLVNVIALVILCFSLTSLEYYGNFGMALGGLFSGFFFDLGFELSDINVYVILMLIVCSNMSFLFNFHYYGGCNSSSMSLMKLLSLFVLVMLFLVSSCSLLSSLMLWEYLGIVSFLLVAFYDSNSSLRGGTITLVSSRFGDVAFFIVLSIYFWGLDIMSLVCFLCWVIIFTKSACFPFGSWLLEAMRAPTPVSSLVHSSTLVAGGVWFLSCYYNVLCLDKFYIYILSSCLLTIIISGLSSLVNMDIKQVVALSTCNNISWVLLISLQGDIYLGVIQLMIHAISKCLLFIYVGDYIVSSGGSQYSNQINNGYYSSFSLVYLLLLLVGLSGLPFLGLYYGKHLFLNMMVCYNLINCLMLVVVWLGFILSCSYCVRLFLFFFSRELFIVGGVRVSFVGNLMVILSVGFLGLVWAYEKEVCYMGYLVTLFVFSSILFGFLLGVSDILRLLWGGCWLRYLCGQDLIVQLYEYFTMKLVSLVSLCLFRWESSLLSFIRQLVVGNLGNVHFNINSLFVGVIFVFLYFIIGY